MNSNQNSDLIKSEALKDPSLEVKEITFKHALKQGIRSSAAVFTGFVLLYLLCVAISKIDAASAKPFGDLRHLLKDHALLMHFSYLFIPILLLSVVVLLRGHKFEWIARNLARYVLPAIAHLLLAAAAVWAVEVSFLYKSFSGLEIFLLLLLTMLWVLEAGLLSSVGEFAMELKNSEGRYWSWAELFMAISVALLIIYYLPELHLHKLPIIKSH